MRGTGTYYNGKPTVCGGWAEGRYSKQCHTYDFTTHDWNLEAYELAHGASSSSTLMLPNNTWMVMGGFGGGNAVNLLHNGTIVRGPNLPVVVQGACTARINDTHIFIGGGGFAGELNIRGVIADLEAWQFDRIANMTRRR